MPAFLQQPILLSPHQRGLSLVELMVSITLSLVLLGGVIVLFSSARTTYENNDHLARIQENARFALNAISHDLREAGYSGCAKTNTFTNALNNSTQLAWNFSEPLTGFESTGTAWQPALDAQVIDAAAVNSDVLVVRGPSPAADAQKSQLAAPMTLPISDLRTTASATYTAGDVLLLTNCEASSIFEVSTYDNATGVLTHVHSNGVTNKSPGNSPGSSIGTAFPSGSILIPMRTIIYYVRASTDPTHGNSLWRRVGISAPEELTEGIDSIQFLYGVDTNADRVVDDYVKADAVTNWRNVISVRIGLLARAVEQYGNTSDTAHTVLDANIPAAADRRERLVFSSTVTLRNNAS